MAVSLIIIPGNWNLEILDGLAVIQKSATVDTFPWAPNPNEIFIRASDARMRHVRPLFDQASFVLGKFSQNLTVSCH